MAFIRLPLGVKVALEFTLHGEPIVNVYHVTTSDPIVSVKLQTIAQVFVNWWTTVQSPAFTSDVVLEQVTALNLDVINGEKHVEIVQPAVPGGIATDALPGNCALVVSMRTSKTGRSFMGRSYLGGLADAGIDGNRIDILDAAVIGNNFLALDAALLAVNAEMVVASFQSLGAPRAEGVATRLNAYGVNTRIDTQRRRLPKF